MTIKSKLKKAALGAGAVGLAALGVYKGTEGPSPRSSGGDQIYVNSFEPAYQPPNIQRQYRASIFQNTGYPWMSNVDVTDYNNVFSVDYPAVRPTTVWPGVSNGQATPLVQTGHYISMAFTVPTDFPLYETNSNMGWGRWTVVGTATEGGAKTVTISTEPGDFNPEHFVGRTKFCEGQAVSESPWLTWAVVSAGYDVLGFCPLERGGTYYMNIVVAAKDDLENSTCPTGACKINIANQATNPSHEE